LPLRQLSHGIGGGRTINGIIDTTLFYHFLTTLHYPNSELVMRQKDNPYRLPEGATFPIWLAGDHFMVAWGQIDSQPPSLMFLDTGLTGASVKLGETMLKDANIQLEYGQAGNRRRRWWHLGDCAVHRPVDRVRQGPRDQCAGLV
jgi:hypothetical protein